MNFPGNDYFEKVFRIYHTSDVIIVSDDIEWCKHYSVFQKYKKNIKFQDNAVEPAVDMAILSLCDVVVLSIGTFGWWGAYLSNGKVIYNENEFKMNHHVIKGNVIKRDYYPPGWTT